MPSMTTTTPGHGGGDAGNETKNGTWMPVMSLTRDATGWAAGRRPRGGLTLPGAGGASTGASPRRYAAVTSSSRATRSSSSTVSTAAIVASSCSGRLAPTIGEVIAGCRSTHATASVGSGIPASLASFTSSSTVSKTLSCQ